MSEMNDAPDDTPSSIGRYEITGTLGFGAMGAVYQAFDPIIKRALAIKTIRLDVPPGSPQRKHFIERFYQEARISGTLSHPNIVTLFDIGEEKGVPFLAMEYVEGQTLAELLDAGVGFEPERVVAVASQVAAALDYAHSRGVIHRDVKPSNLIVQEGDKVKVTDFGIAKLMDSEITQTGALLGTPSYMSPEQAMGEPLDGRSDIFSLGVCAFEMLSGEQPFPGNNVTSILYRLVHVDPVEPATLEMSGVVPQRWREVFHKVLAKKPDARFQKAGDFVRDLENCLGTFFPGFGDDAAALATPNQSTVTIEAPRPEDLPPTEEASAEPAGESETLVLPAVAEVEGSSLDDSATVRMEASATVPGDGETVALPSAGVPDDGKTVALPTSDGPGDGETVVLPASGASDDPGPTVVLEAPLPSAATMPPTPTEVGPAAAPLPGPGRPLPASWLLGGAAGLFVVAVVIVGWMLWSRGGGAGPSAGATPTALPVTEAPVPATGTLLVESEPPGALVSVDGEDRGQTPLELAEVAFGDHEVRLALEGYEEQSLEVSLAPESPTAELRAELSRRRAAGTRGTASFVSVPPGATVFVDGKRVGTTPLNGLPLSAGEHDVSLTLDDHDRWSGSVRVAAGRRVKVEKELTSAAPEAPPTPEPVDTARVYENKLGEVDVPARRKSGMSPSYPRDRLGRLKSGERVSVTITFLVTEAGTVEDVEVVDSAGKAVDDVVVSAIREWKYEPATIRGTPVKVRETRRQTFLGG